MLIYQPKLKKKRQFIIIFLKARFILYILILVGGIIFALMSDYFSIKRLSIVSSDSNKDYQDFIVAQLANRNIFIFWLFKFKQFEKELLNKYPIIGKVNFQFVRLKPGDIELKVEIVLRKEIGLYCYNKECYFFDQTGYLFKKGDENLEKYLPVLILPSFSGQPYKISQLIPYDIVQNLTEIKRFSHDLNLQVRRVELTAIEDYKISLANYEAYFLVEKNALANNLLNLKVFLTKKLNDDVHYLEKVVYLDARYSDKVFEMLK